MSKIRLNGTTSGYTEIAPPAAAGSNTITLPSSNGTANQFLKNGSTAGTLGWSSMVETATGDISINGVLNVTAPTSNGVCINGSGACVSGYTGNWNYAQLQLTRESSNVALAKQVSFLLDGDSEAYTNLSDVPGFWCAYASTPTTGSVSKNLSTSLNIGAPWEVRIYTNNGSGVITGGPYVQNGGTSWVSGSDERLKNIIEPLSDALDRIEAIRAVKYTWKSDPDGPLNVGVIAQDVQAVLPEIVTSSKSTDPDDPTEYLGVSYELLTPLLIAALQEAKTKIQALEANNASLEARITALEAA